MKYGFGPFHPGSPPKDMPGPKKNLGMVTHVFKDFAKLFYIVLPFYHVLPCATPVFTIVWAIANDQEHPMTQMTTEGHPFMNSKSVLNFDP